MGWASGTAKSLARRDSSSKFAPFLFGAGGSSGIAGSFIPSSDDPVLSFIFN
jgi:hypothetical protein